MKNVYYSLILSFVLFSCDAQDRFAKVEIKPHKLTDNIYMLEGSGGNIGLILGEEGAFMIDDQFAPLSDKIRAAVKNLGAENIKYLANTHWHGDHTGGNENFGNDGAVIVAHDNVRLRMSTEQVRGERVTPPSPAIALPKLTFSDNMNMYVNGEDVKIIHVSSAHTDGDAFVWLPKSNVLHMGDCFFNGRFPFMDLNSGGSVNGAVKAVEVALMLVDSETQIIPGHGPMATKADLKSYSDMLSTIKSRVYSEIGKGTALADINVSTMIKGYESFDGGFISGQRLIETIFKSLTEQ